MAGVSELTGTPWHTEKMLRKEGDPRRHRSMCIYFEKESEYCEKRFMKCVGSAHCDYYCTSRKRVRATRSDSSPKKKVSRPARPFQGIKMIARKDIYLGESQYKEPSHQKIKKLIEYYEKHGTMDEPVVVVCQDDKYLLKDKYLRYYVAEKLGLEKIPAQMEIEEKQNTTGAYTVGRRIHHINIGTGTIVKRKLDVVEIKFDSGAVMNFDIQICSEGNIITLL